MKKIFLLWCLVSSTLLYAGDIVFYIHGFFNDYKSNFQKEEALLREKFSHNDPSVSTLPWDGMKKLELKLERGRVRVRVDNWVQAKANAEAFANVVAQKILLMSEAEQREVVLVGHSLGGRCVVYTASILKKHNVKIKQIFLLGAAISAYNPKVPDCGEVVRDSVFNVCNTKDAILDAIYRKSDKESALGLYGLPSQLPGWKEIKFCREKDFLSIFGTETHEAITYMQHF